jgi:5-methylthioadenosine/S-adenosylhomocysteine deaminase
VSDRILIKHATIVSMDSAVGNMEAGDILIDKGKIVAVAPNIDDWSAQPLDRKDAIAIPGFVNAHLHLWQTALRGLAADWTVDEYFGALIGRIVKAYTPQDVYIGNLCGALDQIGNGVTTLFDWSHIVNSPQHADAAVDALKESKIRAVFAYGTPMTLFGTKEPHPTDARRMRNSRLSSDDALVTMALAIRGTDFAPGTAEDDIRLARELGIYASFHVACLKHGPRVQFMPDLARQGLLGPDINLVHANFLEPDELAVVAEKGASITITPEAEMQMGLGFPPTNQVRDAGIRLSLGSDVVSGAGTDMFTQMRFLLQTHRAMQNDLFHREEKMPDKLNFTTREVLELATIKGAACLGLDARIGSITPGKAADIVLLRTDSINMRPILDPVSTVVLHAGVGDIDTVIVDGVILKKGGKLQRYDVQTRMEQLERSAVSLGVLNRIRSLTI